MLTESRGNCKHHALSAVLAEAKAVQQYQAAPKHQGDASSTFALDW